MTRSLTEITRPQTKKSEKRETQTMNTGELKIRVAINKNLDRPSNRVKTDIIFYKWKAGRINHWVTRENSANYDIVSYYFTYNDTEISVFDDLGLIKCFKIS